MSAVFFPGDTWAKGQLEAGDEFIRVNGTSFEGMTHYEAWNCLKAIPDGLVTLRIRRKMDNADN